MAQWEVQILAHVPEHQPAVYSYQSHPHHPLKLLDWLAANPISPESWDVSNKRFPILLGPSLIILTSLEWELSRPLWGNLHHGPLKHYVWPRRVEFESLCGSLVMSFQACRVMVMCRGDEDPGPSPPHFPSNDCTLFLSGLAAAHEGGDRVHFVTFYSQTLVARRERCRCLITREKK